MKGNVRQGSIFSFGPLPAPRWACCRTSVSLDVPGLGLFPGQAPCRAEHG